MPKFDLQALCQQGQELLMQTRYLDAEEALVDAEKLALDAEDYDTLARLYMPLQEARRQRRQICGEGVVRLDLIASGASHQPDPEQLAAQYPHGQLLVAGWASVAPAVRLREIQRQRKQFAETILAAAYPLEDGGRAVVLVPLPEVKLPGDRPTSLEALRAAVPPYCGVLHEKDLPRGEQRCTWNTFAYVMSLWEKLHAPFLAAADAGNYPREKIDGYRRTIEVDYACELAHQRLSAVAHTLARERAAGAV